MIRRTLIVAVTALAIALGVASPALAAGAVANHCGITAPVQVWKKVYSGSRWSGATIEDLRCGEGTSRVWRATVKDHPYYTKLPGSNKLTCHKAGTYFYPNNGGGDKTVQVIPTKRCSIR